MKKRKAAALIIAAAILLSLFAGCGILNKISEKLGIKQAGETTTYTEVTQEDLAVTQKWGTIPLNQIVVILEDTKGKKFAEAIAKELNGSVTGEISYINLYQISFDALDENTFNTKIEQIQEKEGVETAFPNAVTAAKELKGTPCSALTDPVFDDENNRRAYDMIGMTDAWKIMKAAKTVMNEVRVGVLDEAIYTGSDEISGNTKIVGDKTPDPDKDDSGAVVNNGLNHGTMVTHVIGADPENAGVTGIASILGSNLTIDVKNLYDGAHIVNPAANDADNITAGLPTSNVSTTIKSLAYLKDLVDSGAKVINCSFGPEKPGAQNEWINKAYRKFFEKMAADHPDVVFVAAAGNEAKEDGAITSTNYYPAGIPLPNIITVGALNDDGTKAAFSNFASGDGEVTLSAGGVKVVMGVDSEGKPIKSSGTSFATPQVSATAALMISIDPTLTAAEIKQILVESSQPGTINENGSVLIPEGMGAGLLRVDNAVLAVINRVREREGESELTRESLLNMSAVEMTAKGGGTKYKVKVILPETAENTASVTLFVTGQYNMAEGDATQTVSAGEEAIWVLELTDPSVFVKAVRNDTGTCAFMTLNKGNYQGKWDAQMTITEDTLLPFIAQVIGESLDAMTAEMGCETTDNGSGSTQNSTVGSTNNVYINIDMLDEYGEEYKLTMVSQDESNGENVDLSALAQNMPGYINDDGSVTFYTTTEEEGITYNTEITLNLDGENSIVGTFDFYMTGSSEEMTLTSEYYIAGTINGTRVE